MGKAKTSKKQKAFSLNNLELSKVKSGVKTYSHNPDVNLRNTEFIKEAVINALWAGDLEAVKDILRSHYDAVDIDETLERVSVSRRTFYDALSHKGNPTARTRVKIMSGLKDHDS